MPVYAVGVERLRSPSFKNVEQTPEPLPGGCQLQVWSYAPILSAKSHDKKPVDPLSLSLSFPENGDERIELALEELKERFPW
jgi:hypothetical protein